MIGPAEIMQRLVEIDNDLATREADLERAAESAVRTKAQYELEFSKLLLCASGPNADARKAESLVALSSLPIYHDHIRAEATLAGAKAAVEVLKHRSTIGQSLLKAQTFVDGGRG